MTSDFSMLDSRRATALYNRHTKLLLCSSVGIYAFIIDNNEIILRASWKLIMLIMEMAVKILMSLFFRTRNRNRKRIVLKEYKDRKFMVIFNIHYDNNHLKNKKYILYILIS